MQFWDFLFIKMLKDILEAGIFKQKAKEFNPQNLFNAFKN